MSWRIALLTISHRMRGVPGQCHTPLLVVPPHSRPLRQSLAHDDCIIRQGEESRTERLSHFLTVLVPGFADLCGVGQLIAALSPKCYRRPPFPCLRPLVVRYIMNCITARKHFHLQGNIAFLLTYEEHTYSRRIES